MRLVRAITGEQLKNIEELYYAAFPADERKPFALLLEKKNAGNVEMLSIEDEQGSFLGLAISVLWDALLLLDYFAVMPQCRGHGVGTEALSLLLARYTGRRFFLEIESTEEGMPERWQRLRRKAFYSAGGLSSMDWKVNLFGVEMEIMAYRCTVGFEEYHEMYKTVFSGKLASRIRLSGGR